MKTFVSLVLLVSGLAKWCVAQPLRVNGLDRAGLLTWTNLICTMQPVYELLKTHSLTSAWSHLAFATNQTRFAVSNALDTATGAVFLRVAWVEGSPLVFDYAFTEHIEPGFAFTTVTGRLEVAFTGSTNGWHSFRPTECYEWGRRQHPIGDGPLPAGRRPYSGDGISAQVFLRGSGSEDSIYLDGVLEQLETGGHCGITGFSGIVWFVGFQTEGIGTFTATRTP